MVLTEGDHKQEEQLAIEAPKEQENEAIAEPEADEVPFQKGDEVWEEDMVEEPWAQDLSQQPKHNESQMIT